MYLKDVLSKFESYDLKIFVDMDGVIADYDVGKPGDYDKKRPLFSSISKLEEISKKSNVKMYILSISRMNDGIKQKNEWLDKFVPFIKKENRIIISREANNFENSKTLKSKYLQELKRDKCKIILIDDDPNILNEIKETNKDVILLKDTVLVD